MLFHEAIAIAKAAVELDGGFCRFVQANDDKYVLVDTLDFSNVLFKTKGGLRGRNSGNVSDVFDLFLKEAELNPRTKQEVVHSGRTYVSWSNNARTVFFECQYDPRVNLTREGYAGNCSFYISRGAKPYVIRTLRAALSRACQNVPNARGTFDPRNMYQQHIKYGTPALEKRAARLYDDVVETVPKPIEPNFDSQTLAIWDALRNGHRSNVTIN
jgi:hypothetical protein